MYARIRELSVSNSYRSYRGPISIARPRMRVELSPCPDTTRARFIITRNDSETGLETMIDHRFQRSGQERGSDRAGL